MLSSGKRATKLPTFLVQKVYQSKDLHMQLIADEVEEQGPDAVEDLAVEAAEEKWDPAVTNLETVQAVKKLRRSKINQPILLEAVVQTEDTVPDLSAELEAADSKITKMAAIEMMNATITRKVLPVDVGEVAAADLEAVVWAAVDLVEVAEEDSVEAAAAVFVEAVAVSVEATVEVIEVDEAVVGEVVAEAVEVTLMVKAARKLQNKQKFKLQEQKKSFSRKKTRNIKNA
jgi:hypothetical protein